VKKRNLVDAKNAKGSTNEKIDKKDTNGPLECFGSFYPVKKEYIFFVSL